MADRGRSGLVSVLLRRDYEGSDCVAPEDESEIWAGSEEDEAAGADDESPDTVLTSLRPPLNGPMPTVVSVNPTMMTPEPPGGGGTWAILCLADITTDAVLNTKRAPWSAWLRCYLFDVPACHAFRSDAATESVSSASERCTPLMNPPGSGRAALSATTVRLNWPA